MSIEEYTEIESGQCHAQLELVRRGGKTNMLNKMGVARVAFEMGYNQLPSEIDDMSAAEYMAMLRSTPDDFREMDAKRLRQIACGAI